MEVKAGTPVAAPELSIIYVTWNSYDYLCESLESIASHSAGVEYEIIVVDNASSDAAKLKQLPYPASIVLSEENLGFARANNLGVKHARGKNLLFLNPDTKVISDALASMLGVLREMGGSGIVGCKLLNSDGSVQTSCIQRFPTIPNQILDIEFLRLRWPKWRVWGIAPLFSDRTEPVEVEVISGACLLIDRPSFELVGGFSTDYFMYAEDVDLCYRVRQRGRQVCYTSEARVIHHGGGTSRARRGSEWIAITQRDAILKFCRRTRGSVYAQIFRMATAVNALCRLLLLAIVYPIRQVASEKQLVHSTSEKWFGVLKWALGLSGRVSRLRSEIN